MTAKDSTDIELAFVNTFIVRTKRERYAMFVKSGRRRRTFLEALYHFHDCNPLRLAYYEGEGFKRRFILDSRAQGGAR